MPAATRRPRRLECLTATSSVLASICERTAWAAASTELAKPSRARGLALRRAWMLCDLCMDPPWNLGVRRQQLLEGVAEAFPGTVQPPPRRDRQATENGCDLRRREALPLREQENLAVTEAGGQAGEAPRARATPLARATPVQQRPPRVRAAPATRRVGVSSAAGSRSPAAPSRTATLVPRRPRARRRVGGRPSRRHRQPHPAHRSQSRFASCSTRLCPSCTSRRVRRTAACAHVRLRSRKHPCPA